MIDTQDLERLVALALASAYVKGEKPLSLMIVSDRPESGKTDIVNKFHGTSGIVILSDVTAYALWRDFKTELISGKLKHIIIPEFLAPISRGSDTVDSFISTMQMLIEEGLTEIHTGFLKPIKLANPVTIGLICCLPRNAFQAHKLDWQISGFLSRFMVITYKYSDNTVNKIFDSIEHRDYLEETKIDLNFGKDSQVEITVPQEVATACRKLSESITAEARKNGMCYGFREMKNIMRCVAANVILDRHINHSERTVATMEDFNQINELSYLINEQFNGLKEGAE